MENIFQKNIRILITRKYKYKYLYKLVNALLNFIGCFVLFQ